MSRIMSFGIVLFSSVSMLSAHQERGSQLPPGTVDGSISPELISDTLAFRLFFSSIAESRSSAPSPPQLTPRQKAKLAPTNLGESDQTAIATALFDFKDQFQQATGVSKANGRVIATSQPVGGPPLTTIINALTENTVTALKTKMTAEGFQRLYNLVQSEKKQMKIVPFPQMAVHSH